MRCFDLGQADGLLVGGSVCFELLKERQYLCRRIDILIAPGPALLEHLIAMRAMGTGQSAVIAQAGVSARKRNQL